MNESEIKIAIRDFRNSYNRLLTSIEQLNLDIQQQSDIHIAAAVTPKWYSLKMACGLKGVSYDTVKSQWWKQPNAGIPDKILNGRKHWRAESIQEWLEVGDSDIEKYVRDRGHQVPNEALKQIRKNLERIGIVSK
jgi:hypothetical protein